MARSAVGTSGSAGTAPTNRLYANTVHFTLVPQGTSGSISVGDVNLQMAEIDKFTWDWTSTTDSNWPAGADKARNHFTDGPITVNMTGGQVDIGFAGIVAKQRSAMKQGLQPDKMDLLRTVYRGSGQVFHQKFMGGVVTKASGDQSDGNKQLSNMISFTFDDMEP